VVKIFAEMENLREINNLLRRIYKMREDRHRLIKEIVALQHEIYAKKCVSTSQSDRNEIETVAAEVVSSLASVAKTSLVSSMP
jgi:hypothetical protein